MSKQPTAPQRLEDALDRLEKIVTELESGKADLETSIALYREGRQLGAFCLERLGALEHQVMLIKQSESGEVVKEALDT